MKTPLFTFNEFKADDKLKELPLIKANMQGINGRCMSFETYQHLTNLFESKGLQKHSLPELHNTKVDTGFAKSEADVEEKLLEPLLSKLGFLQDDYMKQMPLRMGRGQAVYPDYVINYDTSKNKEKAEYIVEAKYSIPTKRQLEIDLGQARTYARRLQSSAIMLVSIEGVWIALKMDDFSLTKSFTWQELNISDNFNIVLDHFKKRFP